MSRSSSGPRLKQDVPLDRRKRLVPSGENLRVRQQIVEYVLTWAHDNHTFVFCQCQAKLNVASSGGKDGVRPLGENDDRISGHEVFTICSGDPRAPFRFLAEVKPSGGHGVAYRKQLLAVCA